MREEGGELTVCLRIVEAGLPSDLSLLDADHDGRDDVGDERRVHVAQFTGGDTVRDQRPDPVCGEARVALVHLPCDGCRGDVLHEADRGGFELPAYGFEVGADPRLSSCGIRDIGFYALGRAAKEMHGDGLDEPVLVLGEGVEGRFRTPQPGCDVVEREVRESFVQKQRDKLIEQLRLSCVVRRAATLAIPATVLQYRSQYCL